MALNVPLDNFASSPLDHNQSTVLAVCIIEEVSKGSRCYVYSTCKLTPERKWRAVASGIPSEDVTDCATMLTGLGGSQACEQSRQASISKGVALFIREMKQSSPLGNEHVGHLEERSQVLEEILVKKMMIKEQVDFTLTITSNDSKMNTWGGFVSKKCLFLKGDGWDNTSIRESVVAALDLAEEQLGCHTVYLCLEKSNPSLAGLVRTLMYAGFEMVHPGVLQNADPKYLALGMEL
ncbi:hypothetical protein BGZ52_004759 [Haplosporangium bisporale]|nr:hypothetical protein BGZ52_004759 [Haplosporangium bisporale]